MKSNGSGSRAQSLASARSRTEATPELFLESGIGFNTSAIGGVERSLSGEGPGGLFLESGIGESYENVRTTRGLSGEADVGSAGLGPERDERSQVGAEIF